MDINSLELITNVTTSGVIASVVTELLKSPLVPIAFEKIPRLTSFVLSAITSVIVLVNQGVTLDVVFQDWTSVFTLATTAFLISSVAYKNITRPSTTRL